MHNSEDLNGVSVIMSVYNEDEIMLQAAIESILKQSFTKLEFIIILDNPCNEEAKKIINMYKNQDQRIVFLENENNLGLPTSLNKGIRIAKYNFLARMDADDISHKNRLELQMGFLRDNPEVEFISGKVEYIDEFDNFINDSKTFIKSVEHLESLLPYVNPFSHPTWMFKKEILNKIGGYREFPSCQDYDFILRSLNKKVKFGFMNEVVLKYRIRSNSISKSKMGLQMYLTLKIQQEYKNGFSQKNSTLNNLKDGYLVNDKEYQEYVLALKMYDEFKVNFKEKRFFRALKFLIKSCFISKLQIQNYSNAYKVKLINRKYKNGV